MPTQITNHSPALPHDSVGAQVGAPLQRMIWLGIGLLWLIFIGATFAYYAFAPSGGHDSDAYYIASQALADGDSPYGELTGRAYLYPPLLAQAFIPFVWIGNQTVYEIALYSSFIMALGLSIWLISRQMPPQWAKWLWLMPIGFYPVWEQLFFGQISVWLLLLMVLAWQDYHAGRWGRVGAWLALATWIKLYPIFLIGLFILRREFRVVRGAFIIGMILGILQTLLAGIDIWGDFFHTLVTLAGEGRAGAMFENHSILGFSSRLFESNQRVMPITENATLFVITRLGMSVMIVVISLIVVIKPAKTKTRAKFDLSYSLTIITSLLIGSVLWFSAMLPLLLVYPLMFLHTETGDDKKGRWVVWGVWVLSYVGAVLQWLGHHTAPVLPALAYSWGTFGMLALWVWLAWYTYHWGFE